MRGAVFRPCAPASVRNQGSLTRHLIAEHGIAINVVAGYRIEAATAVPTEDQSRPLPSMEQIGLSVVAVGMGP